MAAHTPHERERSEMPGTTQPPVRDPGFAPAGAPTALRTTNPDDLPAGDARDRSIGNLIRELRDESSTLIRQELALAKTEMSEKLSGAARNAASIAIGGVVAYLGVLILLLGATTALYFGLVAWGMSHFWAGIISFLAVGILLAAIGYGMIQKGISTLKNESLVPQKTVQSLKEDKQWLTNQTR